LPNHEDEIEALGAILRDTRTELERSTEERERTVLGLYCQYLEARVTRLRSLEVASSPKPA
jgi:hypothetical protein